MQQRGERNEVTGQPIDDLRQKFKHLDIHDFRAGECRVGRVAETEAADENIKFAAPCHSIATAASAFSDSVL